LSTNAVNPLRGEIWLVNFNPTVGAEIQKTRPAVVISSDGLGILPLRVVVPITEWKERYSPNLWHVKIMPDTNNGLSKPSAADALQLRGIDLQRLMKRVGRLKLEKLEEIAAAIAAVVEFE
jgi:mRNA interferase MazF